LYDGFYVAILSPQNAVGKIENAKVANLWLFSGSLGPKSVPSD
jgi:hypothetical protein